MEHTIHHGFTARPESRTIPRAALPQRTTDDQERQQARRAGRQPIGPGAGNL